MITKITKLLYNIAITYNLLKKSKNFYEKKQLEDFL